MDKLLNYWLYVRSQILFNYCFSNCIRQSLCQIQMTWLLWVVQEMGRYVIYYTVIIISFFNLLNDFFCTLKLLLSLLFILFESYYYNVNDRIPHNCYIFSFFCFIFWNRVVNCLLLWSNLCNGDTFELSHEYCFYDFCSEWWVFCDKPFDNHSIKSKLQSLIGLWKCHFTLNLLNYRYVLLFCLLPIKCNRLRGLLNTGVQLIK